MGAGRHLIGTVLQETFRIERLVGKGGMGAVYEASHLRLPRRFAVKVLSPEVAEHAEALARFRREAEIASGLGHPHILEVIDFNNTPDGTSYILMEYLDGEDLASRIKRRKGMDLAETAAIFRQASSALHAAHERGVIHRDLKPQNIFLCNRGERDDYVKVVDFGISKVLGSQSVVTKTHALMGTPCYMSPEQAEQRAAEVDQRTDVYAMGVIVFEMLAGAPPFFGDSVPALLYTIVHKQAPSLRSLGVDVPDSIEHIIAKALAKKREDRFFSMRAFWQAFETAMEQEQVEFVESTEDRQTQWTGRPSSAVEAESVQPPLSATALTELPHGAAPAIFPTVHASQAAAASGIGKSTTLSSSVGEVQQPTEAVVARLSKRVPIIIGGATVVLVLAVVAFSFFGTKGTREADGPGAVKLTAKPPAVPKTEKPQAPAKVEPKAPRVFQIAITADDPKVVCRVRVDDGPTQTQFVPCKFRARAGQRFSLKAVRRGLKGFAQEWTVEAPRTLALEVLEKARRVVLAGEELPTKPAKRTVPKRRARKRRSTVTKVAPKVAPPKEATEAARKPEAAARPPDKPKPKRRRIGEGVLDF